MAGRSRGRVWIDAKTGQVFQGSKPVDDLQPLERTVLEHFLEQPYSRHTYTEIINAAWPAGVAREGVSNDALYQIIRKLRLKLEPDPGSPRYVINWRGTPEGGYQFYPEGRPA
jgi:DNA-binding response OmpR family regulator